MNEWIEESWHFQQAMARFIGDRWWDHVPTPDIIVKKIDHAFTICYGENFFNDTKCAAAFEKLKTNVNSYVVSHEMKYFNSLFINIRLKDEKATLARYCVFRLKNHYDAEIYMDKDSRKYTSWKDFLDNNILPKCFMIFPEQGTYALRKNKIEFVDLSFQESVACSGSRSFKTCCDVVVNVAGAASLGVLMFNPLTAPVAIGMATAGTVVSGVYNIGNAACKIDDICTHSNIDLSESESLLAIADMALSVVGTAAVGITAGAKLVAQNTKLFSEAALLLKLANGTRATCQVFCAAQSVYYFCVIIHKHENGNLTAGDLKYFGYFLLFVYNIYLTDNHLKRLLTHISEKLTIHTMKDLLMGRRLDFGPIKHLINNVGDALELLFPSNWKITKHISNFKSIVMICNRVKTMLEDRQNPLQTMFNLITELPKIAYELGKCLDAYKNDTVDVLEQCPPSKAYCLTQAIDNYIPNGEISDVAKYLTMPVEIKDQVSRTIRSMFAHLTDSELKARQVLLFEKIMTFVVKHDLNNFKYTTKKVEYYIDQFIDVYSKMMNQLHLQYFSYCASRVNESFLSKGQFFKSYMGISNLESEAFNKVLSGLESNLDRFRSNYDDDFNQYCSADVKDEATGVIAFKTKHTVLDENVCREICLEQLPQLHNKLNSQVSIDVSFEKFGTIVSNDFKVCIILEEIKKYFNGIIVYTKVY